MTERSEVVAHLAKQVNRLTQRVQELETENQKLKHRLQEIEGSNDSVECQ